MKYWAPINSADGINGNDGYVDGDPGTGLQGSIPTFRALEQPMRALVNLVTKAGLTPSATIDDIQVAQAVQAGKLIYATAAGTANALVVTLDPVPVTYPKLLLVKATASNSAGATINPNGLGAVAILRNDGGALQAFDITTGDVHALAFDGTNYRLVAMARSQVPVRLAAALTLYVRADGNDANDGLTDTAGGAFRQIQAAINKAMRSYLANGYTITIRVGDGAYAAFTADGPTGSTLLLVGNQVTPANVTVNNGGTSDAIVAINGAKISLDGFTTFSNSAFADIVANLGSIVYFQRHRFAGVGAHVSSAWGAHVFCQGPYTIAASAQTHWRADPLSSIEVSNVTVTLLAGVGFASNFAAVDQARINAVGNTYSGTATGKRYTANTNGVIFTNGAGVNALPGNVAGSVANGGIYA